MPRTPDPLTGMTRLLVDGTNLLHALGRADGPLPPAAVIGRLRALVPSGVQATVVLDGTPAPGAIDRRLTSGIEVRYSGKRPADALLVDLAGMAPSTTLVVTDDNDLATSLRRFGARTVRNGWMADQLGRQRLESPAAGRPRPPAHQAETTGDEEPPRPGWNPGRGATKKTGNPKRGTARPAEGRNPRPPSSLGAGGGSRRCVEHRLGDPGDDTRSRQGTGLSLRRTWPGFGRRGDAAPG